MQTQAVYDETPDQLKLVAFGEQAIETLKKTFEVHMAIARGFAIGIEHAHCVARTDDPSDRSYQKAFSGWLDRYPKYRAFNKPYRHWAVRCLDYEAEILKWRAEQGDRELAKFHYPETVFKRWAKANHPELLTDKQRGESSAGEPKPPTVSKRDQAIIDLRQEIETLSREKEELRAEKERLEQLREQEPVDREHRWTDEPSAIARAWWDSPERDRIAAACKAFLAMAKGGTQEVPDNASTKERRKFDFWQIGEGNTLFYREPQAATSSAAKWFKKKHNINLTTKKVYDPDGNEIGTEVTWHKKDEGSTEGAEPAPTDDRPTRPILRRRDRSEDGAPAAEGGAPGAPLQNPAEASAEVTRDEAAQTSGSDQPS